MSSNIRYDFLEPQFSSSTPAPTRPNFSRIIEKVPKNSAEPMNEDLLLTISKELRELSEYQARGPSVAQFIWSSLLQISAVSFAVASVVVSIYAWKAASVANNLTFMANRFAMVAICQAGTNDLSINCNSVYQQAANYLNEDINSLFNPSGTTSSATVTTLIPTTTVTSSSVSTLTMTTTTQSDGTISTITSSLASTMTGGGGALSTGYLTSTSTEVLASSSSSTSDATPTPAQPTSPAPGGTANGSSPGTHATSAVAIIAGSVVSGVALLLALLASSYFAWKHQRRRGKSFVL